MPGVEEKIELFFGQFKLQRYSKGEIFIRADDDPQGIYFLREGIVKVYAISKKGDELVINIFKPQSFFPMSWALNSTTNPYYYEAVTDLVVFRAPKAETVAFIRGNPDVLFDLMSRVYKGVDGLLTRMTYLMAGSAFSRLATEILIQAKRFGKKEGPHVSLSISETELASQSGMTRETVSREMKILKERGLVDLNKSTLIIKDMTKLEEELMGGV
ncbi:MAG: Crp/Fnr family transcriptional regulator [Candidatus Levybacteria bacterium]|nr:Crp/Fnr family transcriptional regulator [Candidatus Levybacteria bacterium]